MNAFIAALAQIAALIGKELLAIVKEPATRTILFGPVLVQSLLFGYGATYDVKTIPYAVFDASRSNVSTELLARLDGSGVFERIATLTSSAQMNAHIDSGKILLALHIPADFADRLASGQRAPLQVILDGRNSSTAAAAASHLNGIVADINARFGPNTPAIGIERRVWYNPNLESRWTIMPALIAALSLIQTLLLSALSVAREREQGTFDQLLVTPLTPIQILIGKAFPAILVGLIQSSLILLIIRFWFEIPNSGSLGLLYLALVIFNLAVVGLGLSISALALTMQQAMLYTFLLIMPMMLLSGLIAPVSNMPEALQMATYANPLRFGINLVRGVYLQGASFGEIWFNFIPLLVSAALTLPLAAWLFRNRLS